MKADIYWNKNRRCVQLIATPEGGTRLARVVASFQKLEDLRLTTDTENRIKAGSYKPMARESSEVRDNRETYIAERAKEILEQVQLDKGEKSAGLTVGYAIDQWNEKHWPALKEAQSKKSLPEGETIYLSELRTMKKLLGEITLEDLTVQKITQAIEPWHPSNDKNPWTYNALLRALSRVLTWCSSRERNWLDRNPIISTGNKNDSLFMEAHHRHDYLELDEYKKLLEECSRSRNDHLVDAVILAVYTGARKNELMNALWSDFDMNNGRLIFSFTKNGQSKSVTLDSTATEVMHKRMKVRAIYSNRIFPRQAKWMNNSEDKDLKEAPDFLDGLKKALVRAGLRCPVGCTHDHRDEKWHREWYPHRKLVWHSLRHTCASIIANNGGTLEDIQAHLGQESPQSAQIYKHLVDDYTKKTSSILEKALAS